MMHVPVIEPTDLQEGRTAYMPAWLVFECEGKFYIWSGVTFTRAIIGTSEVPVTRRNGVIVIGKGYDTPSKVGFDWLGKQSTVEVTLE
jgi:hypothetical protein